MASSIVKVSGMFGNNKTYFVDSPVVIDIDGLEWPSDSPFNIVRVKVVSTVNEFPTDQLNTIFPNSSAIFYNSEKGYANGAEIWYATDAKGVLRRVLVITSYSKEGAMNPSYAKALTWQLQQTNSEWPTLNEFCKKSGRIVEFESTQARRDTLLQLCADAYSAMFPTVGDFRADTGGQSSISFDINSALRAIWSGYNFAEVGVAENALTGTEAQVASRYMLRYSLRIYTEYLSSDDGGVFTTTQCEDEDGNTLIPGGQCLIGGLTEWERYTIGEKENADVSHLEHTGVRNGDASTKPTSSPERVGSKSITSWVDVQAGFTKSVFYPAAYNSGYGEADDVLDYTTGWTGHAPLVLRDSQEYVDFLFVNRRGAVETCSGMTKEALTITVEKQDYTLVERPVFCPSRSLMSLKQGDPRRSWDMSSGLVDREWAEWWAMEFLPARRHWMLYKGRYVPVIVTPAKKAVSIYDKAKQQMPHVDFTVTLALEG